MFMNGKELKMEIKQLEYFAAAVEYGSLNRAAENMLRRWQKYAGDRNDLCRSRRKDRQGVCEHGNGSGYGSACQLHSDHPARIAALAKEVFLRSSWSAEAAEDLRTAKFRHISRM